MFPPVMVADQPDTIHRGHPKRGAPSPPPLSTGANGPATDLAWMSGELRAIIAEFGL